MLRSFFDSADEFNEAYWVLMSSWSGWTLVGLGITTVAILWLAQRNTGSLEPTRRRILLGLRLAAIALIWLVFLQPGVRLEDRSTVRNHIVVLADESRSMGLPLDDKSSRIDALQASWDSQVDTFTEWSKVHQVEYFGFSDRLEALNHWSDAKASGDSTRLMTALEEISARFDAEDLAAIVIASDGSDNGALGGLGGLTPSAKLAVTRLGVPIHTVFVGPDEPPRDIVVADVAYDEFAFVRNAVTIRATIDATGFSGLTLPVTLKRQTLDDADSGTEVLGVRQLTIEKEKRSYTFDFEFVPDATGKSIFSLTVEPPPNETITENNRRDFTIRVIRDKIRVLQVVGQPSWDERFLRKFLKKNPNVDLISFFILRTSESVDPARKDELSLIPFPTQELFEEQLGSFDLIIFQNFTYRGYRMKQYLPLIRNYVKNGGGFVMVGGDLSFASGGYAGTPIEDFLPVILPKERSNLVWDGDFVPAVTETGRNHPITALSHSPDLSEEIWKSLPPLLGMNAVLGSHPEADVLLAHPSQRAGEQAAPIVSTRQFGRGRTLAITTDTTWHWDFKAAGNGLDNRHYYKFWGNVIRWLIRDPALKPIRVSTDRDRYPLGSAVEIMVRVTDSSYQPANNRAVNVAVKRRQMNGSDGQLEQPVILSGSTNEVGEFTARFTPETDGPWTVTATADGEAEVTDTNVFIIATDPIELRETAPNPELLKGIAEASSGRWLKAQDSLANLERVEPKVLKINRRKDVPVWSSGLVLLLAVIFPSLEWFLRRRWGLL